MFLDLSSSFLLLSLAEDLDVVDGGEVLKAIHYLHVLIERERVAMLYTSASREWSRHIHA